MTEAQLQRQLAQALRDRGAWAVKVHGNSFQSKGTPDILCCYRGKFIAIEVKRAGKVHTVTKLQRHQLDGITDAGGIALVVTDWPQLKGILDYLDRR